MNKRYLLSVVSSAVILAGFVGGVNTAIAQSTARRCENERGDAQIAACSELIRSYPKLAGAYYYRGNPKLQQE